MNLTPVISPILLQKAKKLIRNLYFKSVTELHETMLRLHFCNKIYPSNVVISVH